MTQADEFHHAKAKSYQKLLEYYKPKVLLGLTATPERADGQNIFEYFDRGITAEMRLYEAIERKLLSPFHYFGVTDSVDLSKVKYADGKYDVNELENLYAIDSIAAKKRAGFVFQAVSNYCLEVSEIFGLGFCVSKKHAKFMSKIFNENGIPSEYLTSESPSDIRDNAKHRLVTGEIRFIFVVDLYNEGVDIPEINTVMFLRPTESLTVYLQQLGRGLRLSEGKEALTVLDFVGHANNKFSFEERFRAMMSKTRNTVEEELKKGFANVPRGCSIQLEKVAQEHILENIKGAIINRKNIINKLRDLHTRTGKIDASEFFHDYNIKPAEVYAKKMTLTGLALGAGLIEKWAEYETEKGKAKNSEKKLTRAFNRLSLINSVRLLKFMMDCLPKIRQTMGEAFLVNNEMEKRLLLMFYYTLYGEPLSKVNEELEGSEKLESIEVAINNVFNDDRIYEEFMSLIKYQYESIDFISEPIIELGEDYPIDLHCSYSRELILVAVGKSDENRKYPSREGTLLVSEGNLDVFFVTLNKSEKEYSPTTMYQDYIINEKFIHGQSQSTTSVESRTGKRYLSQLATKNKVLLFVRENTKENEVTMPFICLGLIEYVEHSGSLPINIKYSLKKAIPAKLLENSMIV